MSEVIVKQEALEDTLDLTSSPSTTSPTSELTSPSNHIILEPIQPDRHSSPALGHHLDSILNRPEKRVSRVIFEPAIIDTSSLDNRSSPRTLEYLHPPGYTDYSYGVTVTLTPNTADGDYLDNGLVGATQLQYITPLTPLPSFHSLPSSPTGKVNYSPPTAVIERIEYSPDDKVEYIGPAVSLTDYITYSSPDSSSQALPTSTSTPYTSCRGGGHKRRRRRDSCSSTGSGASSTSRQLKRRRTPISQEELMLQRNQGDLFYDTLCYY